MRAWASKMESFYLEAFSIGKEDQWLYRGRAQAPAFYRAPLRVGPPRSSVDLDVNWWTVASSHLSLLSRALEGGTEHAANQARTKLGQLAPAACRLQQPPLSGDAKESWNRALTCALNRPSEVQELAEAAERNLV